MREIREERQRERQRGKKRCSAHFAAQPTGLSHARGEERSDRRVRAMLLLVWTFLVITNHGLWCSLASLETHLVLANVAPAIRPPKLLAPLVAKDLYVIAKFKADRALDLPSCCHCFVGEVSS